MTTDPVGPPLPGDLESAQQRVPARTMTYWRTRALLVGVPLTALSALGALRLGWPPPAVRWGVVAAVALWWLVIGAVAGPPIRRRLFWYSVSADEIDLQHGLFVVTRTVVPMNRVQHLEVRRGALADRFRVASLRIHTAAGSVAMHGLDAGEAERVRERIGRLAGLADDV